MNFLYLSSSIFPLATSLTKRIIGSVQPAGCRRVWWERPAGPQRTQTAAEPRIETGRKRGSITSTKGRRSASNGRGGEGGEGGKGGKGGKGGGAGDPEGGGASTEDWMKCEEKVVIVVWSRQTPTYYDLSIAGEEDTLNVTYSQTHKPGNVYLL